MYTAGELAKKLGVSARTVRFYDEKNLLSPKGYSESGYRLYNDESAERLQKILMLRFMDFSIEQIADMMGEEDFDVKKSLEDQERLLLAKKEHLERIITAVQNTKNIRETSDPDFWKNMRHIIEITKEREYVIAQYDKEENLNARVA